MSHFLVLVIGDEPEEELRPFSAHIDHNANAKWDGYTLNNYWFLTKIRLKEWALIFNKDAEQVSQALKGDIDFELMRKEAYQEASSIYEEFASYFPNKEIPIPKKSFRQILNENKGEDISFCKFVYEKQLEVKMIRDAKRRAGGDGLLVTPSFDPEDFALSKEAFSERAANNCLAPYAILKDGVWRENKGDGRWIDTVWSIIDSSPEDALLSLYDCHI